MHFDSLTFLWAHSSAGRAPALQAGGHRFEPYCAHHKLEIRGKKLEVRRHKEEKHSFSSS